MQRKLLVSAAITGALLSGCATQSNKAFQPFQAEDLNPLVKSGKLVQKTNSFVVLNDTSSSMGHTFINSVDYSGSKLDVEKNLLNKFNKTIPDMPLTSALRSFGYGPCTDWSSTKLNQGVQQYSSAAFEGAINSMTCSSGGTPLADAVVASSGELASSNGNIALIILSDGIDETSPVPAVQALKQQYGDRLCVHTVWVGNEQDLPGQADLQAIADVSGACGGIATDAATISSAAGMSNFVQKVFLKEGKPVATDGDDDQDGVLNSRDKCPDTPKGAVVDRDGCWSFHGVLFDFDSSKITPKADALIQNAVHVLKLNPGLTIAIEGHTDSKGSDAYNQKLSERRAAAVKNEIVRLGISSSRLSTVGFGESQPVDTNETDQGRAYNRRVSYRRTDRH